MDAERRVARYKNLMTKHHDTLVKLRQLNIRDLVLKRVSLATKDPTHGKLGPNWEGLYRVINYKRRGSYYLEALDGQRLEHSWNVEHLRKYYQWKLVKKVNMDEIKDCWWPLAVYLCYLSAFIFSSSILCFLAFEFPKKH